MDNNQQIPKQAENVVSPEIKKVLSKPPKLILIIGNATLFLIICTLLALSGSVKHSYPLKAEVILFKASAGAADWDITATVPARDAEKIRTGQTVTIELNDFPAAKYGHVSAVVISKGPANLPGQKLVVKLQKSSVHPALDQSTQSVLKGKATIGTAKKSLLEKFIYRNN